MSLPNQPQQQRTTAAASPSLSSSRQSVRATSGPSTHPAPEHSQHDDPHDNNASQRYGNDQLLSGFQHAQDPHPHPQFQPFFTLVEDANTGEYHHPTVHYIFSDDDTDILTEAAVRSLEQEQQESDNQAGVAARGAGKVQRQHRHRQGQGQDESEEGESYEEENVKDSILPPPIPGVRDNYLILDVEPTPTDTLQQQQQQQPKQDDQSNAGGGLKSISSSPANQPTTLPPPPQQPQQQSQFKVASAHSLTPTWQVLNTELVPAPTFENNASPNDPKEQQEQLQPQPLNGGLMLKIHGTRGQPPITSTKDKDKDRGSQRLEDMMDQFAKRMGELQRVIEAGEVSGLGTGLQPGLDGEDHERGQLEQHQQQQQQDIGVNQLVEDHDGNANNTAEEVSGQEEGKAGPSNTN